MTDEERKALVERLRQGHEGPAARQIEADGQRIAELEAALRGVLMHRYGDWCGIARAALETKP